MAALDAGVAAAATGFALAAGLIIAIGAQNAFVLRQGLRRQRRLVCVAGWGARWLAPWFARPAAWRALDTLIGLTMLLLATLLARHALA